MLSATGRPKCAGVIVFHYGVPSMAINSDEKSLHVVVVKKAKQLAYPWGFPKGGREANETVLENALRELREETGIVKDQLHILSDLPMKEYHNDILTVLYYVAKFVGDPWKHKFTYSADELETACWMPVHEVQEAPVSTGMKPGRLDMLKRTVEQFEEILYKKCPWV
jgi:8-oxo-dGTP pyrophosphatase MutT (NUDIX family)